MLVELLLLSQTLPILLRFEPSGSVPDAVGLIQATRPVVAPLSDHANRYHRCRRHRPR